jgi:hypothetical protein
MTRPIAGRLTLLFLRRWTGVVSAADANLQWYKVSGAWFLGAHYGPNGQL